MPLALATFSVARSSTAQSRVTDLTLDWLEDNESDLELDEVNVFNTSVGMVLHGSSEPEPLDDLRASLEEAFPQMEEANLRINVAKLVPVPEVVVEE